MFGRVSTVPLWAYANEPNPFNPFDSAIILGKKWTSGYDSQDRPAILSWINTDATSLSDLYPEYSMPDEIPEWVNAYNPSTHGTYTGGSDLRALVGDGTNSLGPLKLHEALYIYSVLKKLSYGGSDTREPSIYNPDYFSESEPYNLFIPQYKYYQYDASVEAFTGFYPEFKGDGRVRIAVDMDNFSDYYILGINALYINRDEGAIYASLSPSKSRFEITGTFLSDVGDSKTVEFGDPPEPYATVTYVSSTVTYSIGEVSKEQKLYGIKIEYTEGNPVSIDPSFTVTATEFWPYKTASGQPVYDTSTGSILNSPLP